MMEKHIKRKWYVTLQNKRTKKVNNKESVREAIKCIITWLIVINIASFAVGRSLICNCPLLKDISFNTKCLLVWRD